jgi:hypothetical protein
VGNNRVRPGSCLTRRTVARAGAATVDDLYRRHNCDGDLCLLKSSAPALQTILLKDFRPVRPTPWKENPNEWLSNVDIVKVLKQYEEAFPYFQCLGPVPIDFDTRIQNKCVADEMCQFSIDNEKKNNKTDVAIVFNLDKHNEPGSHWTSLYIDLVHETFYYFDSAKNNTPPEVTAFCKRVAPRFAFFKNTITHQRGNTECGMYSLYFIIEMLSSPPARRRAFFARRFNNSARRINDKVVEKFRSVYFTPL